MFQLNDQFLKDLGVDELPEDQQRAFLDHVYSQLELRVGTKLSQGLSEEQLAEFESFIDRDSQKVQDWLSANVEDYQNDPVYLQLKSDAPSDDEMLVKSEYASLRWLGKNRPDYKQVVSDVLDEIKQEILDNKDMILAA